MGARWSPSLQRVRGAASMWPPGRDSNTSPPTMWFWRYRWPSRVFEQAVELHVLIKLDDLLVADLETLGHLDAVLAVLARTGARRLLGRRFASALRRRLAGTCLCPGLSCGSLRRRHCVPPPSLPPTASDARVLSLPFLRPSSRASCRGTPRRSTRSPSDR